MPSLDTQSATELYDMVNATAISPSITSRLRAAIDERLSAQHLCAIHKGHAGSAKPQRLENLAMYLTAQDWQQLHKPDLPTRLQMVVVSNRFTLLGISSWHEQTAKSATILVVHLYFV